MSDETPMQNKDKFLWGPGDVQIIDFDPKEVTPAYHEKLKKAVDESDMDPDDKRAAYEMLEAGEFSILYELMGECHVMLPSERETK